jgi:hypothetical protein
MFHIRCWAPNGVMSPEFRVESKSDPFARPKTQNSKLKTFETDIYHPGSGLTIKLGKEIGSRTPPN